MSLMSLYLLDVFFSLPTHDTKHVKLCIFLHMHKTIMFQCKIKSLVKSLRNADGCRKNRPHTEKRHF